MLREKKLFVSCIHTHNHNSTINCIILSKKSYWHIQAIRLSISIKIQFESTYIDCKNPWKVKWPFFGHADDVMFHRCRLLLHVRFSNVLPTCNNQTNDVSPRIDWVPSFQKVSSLLVVQCLCILTLDQELALNLCILNECICREPIIRIFS